MSTKTLGVVGRGLGRRNFIPTIPTVPTIPTIPTPWGCSKLKPEWWNADYSDDDDDDDNNDDENGDGYNDDDEKGNLITL